MLQNRNRTSLPILNVLLGLIAVVTAFREPTKFLIVSNPVDAKVGYVEVPTYGGLTGKEKAQTLIASGLRSPQGLYMDQKRHRLLIADPELGRIVAYGLAVHDGRLVADSTPVTLAEPAVARWVTVDGVGTIFFTEESNHRIMKVTLEQLQNNDTTPVEIYSEAMGVPIRAPGGIDNDNFRVLWTNKLEGIKLGTVMFGAETRFLQPGSTEEIASVKFLAKNLPKAYGLCVAKNNVYYTSEESAVYTVKRTGDLLTRVTHILASPRGCVWDGDSTVYVADRSLNAVYSFSGPMVLPSMDRPVKKAVDFDGAFGVAVYSTGVGSAKRTFFGLL